MSQTKSFTLTPVKEIMISWHHEGKAKTLKEIADLTRKAHSIVQSIINKWKDAGCVENKQHKGRPSTFIMHDANKLKWVIKINIGASMSQILKTFLAKNAKKFRKTTLYRQLKNMRYV